MKRHVPLVAFALGLAVAGCGGGSKCSKACRKIDQCYGDAGGAPACTFSAACTQVEQCQASCISNASCDALMGKDPTAQQALQACIAQCGAVPADQSVIIPEGGADMGPFPEWGLPDVYVPDDIAPTADLYTGPPRAKFCNNLLLDNNKFTAHLTLGTQPSQWVAQAYSGECQPVLNVQCPIIPLMTNPTVDISDGTQSVVSGTLNITITNGQHWIFAATVDANSQATVEASQLKPEYPCQTTDIFTTP